MGIEQKDVVRWDAFIAKWTRETIPVNLGHPILDRDLGDGLTLRDIIDQWAGEFSGDPDRSIAKILEAFEEQADG